MIEILNVEVNEDRSIKEIQTVLKKFGINLSLADTEEYVKIAMYNKFQTAQELLDGIE